MSYSRAQIASTLVAVVVTCVIALPVVSHVVSGISLTSIWEESIGYRYFYTLRMIYGDERPWIPQAQLPGLVHIVVQHVLTLFGYPVGQLFPRIDVFTYMASLIPIAICGVMVFVACRQFRSIGAKALLGCSLLATVFSPPMLSGWMTNPDYMLWILPVALLTLAWALHLPATDSHTRPMWLALFGGICISIKPTLFVFPLLIYLVYWTQRRKAFKYVDALSIAGVSLLVWMLMILLYYEGDLVAFGKYFVNLKIFMASQKNTLPSQAPSLLTWLTELGPAKEINLKSLPLLAPILLIVVTVFVQSARRHIVLLIPTLLSIAILYQRYYVITLIEAEFFAYVVLALTVTVAFDKLEINSAIRQKLVYLKTDYLRWGACVLLVGAFGPIALERARDFYDLNRVYQSASGNFDQQLERQGGRIAFLTADNTYRLRTVDSAICKGGTDIFAPEMGLSPFMRSLFPNRWCGQVRQAVDLEQFAKVAFLRLADEPLDQAVTRLERDFSSSLNPFDCSTEVPTVGGVLVLCSKVKNR